MVFVTRQMATFEAAWGKCVHLIEEAKVFFLQQLLIE